MWKMYLSELHSVFLFFHVKSHSSVTLSYSIMVYIIAMTQTFIQAVKHRSKFRKLNYVYLRLKHTALHHAALLPSTGLTQNYTQNHT